MDAFMKSLVILGFVFVSKFTIKNLIKNWVNLLLVLFTETRLDFFLEETPKSDGLETTILSTTRLQFCLWGSGSQIGEEFWRC